MRAARMYGYRQPLKLEDIPIPDIAPTRCWIKVGAAGMCRTDFQLVDGYFRSAKEFEFPLTPGHEISGWRRGVRRGDGRIVDVVAFFDAIEFSDLWRRVQPE